MSTRPLRTLALAAAATVGLSACTTLGGYGYGDDYGYGGSGYGYGSADYGYNPYYGGGTDPYGYGAGSYYGWYDNYYYPGVGFNVYDTYGQRYRWNDSQQRYWNGRLRGYRGERRENWQDYRRGRGDRDGDGIRNRYDATPGGRYGRERRDRDGDGIRDRYDATPNGPDGRMRRDRNRDGIRDRAPRPNGDRDRDGIRNRYDATPGGPDGRMRRDSDGDGIRDRVDATPRGPDGRMRRDRNGDGIRDGAQRRGRDGRGRGPRAETITGPDSTVREAIRLQRRQEGLTTGRRTVPGPAVPLATPQVAVPAASAPVQPVARPARRSEGRIDRGPVRSRTVEPDRVRPN